jgi:hypothetical protein
LNNYLFVNHITNKSATSVFKNTSKENEQILQDKMEARKLRKEEGSTISSSWLINLMMISIKCISLITIVIQISL